MKTLLRLLLLALAACSLPIDTRPVERRLFLLEVGPSASVENRAPLRLTVSTMTAPRYLDSQKILFRKRGGELGTYQQSFWAEPPPKQLTTYLISALEGHFASVSRPASGALGEVQLNTELTDFSLWTEPENKVVVGLLAELIDTRTRRVIARERFLSEQKIAVDEPVAVVRAFSELSTSLIATAVRWTVERGRSPLPVVEDS